MNPYALTHDLHRLMLCALLRPLSCKLRSGTRLVSSTVVA